MESEIRIEENDAKIVETDAEKSCFSPSLPKHIADPVVYKLVRLEGNGRLVPATDDEIIKVESLLVDSTEMHIVADELLDVGCNPKEEPSSRMLHHENLEGSLQTVGIEKGLDNESTRLEASGSSLASTLVESDINQSESSGDCVNLPDKLTEGVLTTSVTVTSNAQPDFSMLKGEICLDNLSIKELHETYRATFGRETTAKDKLWLKRRITMGLTNSCDVLTASFIIKDNKLVKENIEGSSNNAEGKVSEDLIIGQLGGNLRDITVMYNGQVDDCHVVSVKNSRNHRVHDGFGCEDNRTEQGTAKRVRKPTRRYIEELSEAESKESGKGLTSLDQSSHVRPSRSISLDESSFITELGSRRGFGILVPRVHWVRRSRPRKDFMALLKFDTSNTDMTTMPVKKILGGHSFNPVNEIGSRDIQGVSVLQQFTDEQEKESQALETIAVPIAHDVALKHTESSFKSDNNMVAVPIPKSGIRRKHHRAWTLSEVTKLVDGVSTYGAGKWSEIKRFAFASSSYRTSVDLKDKWRNLLKASFTPIDKGTNVRKSSNGPIPIPAPILLKVRELAGLHQQIPANVGSSKMVETTEIYVQERQSGFL